MYVIIGIVFTLRAQGHLGAYDGGGGQEEEEEKKYSSGEVMSTFGPVYLWHWISTKDDANPTPPLPRWPLAMIGDIFGCPSWRGTIDI